MTTDASWEAARELFDSALEVGMVPGIAASAGQGRETRFRYIGGQALVQGGHPEPLRDHTWFDLASLTKVMATLPALMVLAGRGDLAFSDPVSQHLQGFSGDWDAITLRHLLTHTAGLAPHRPLYETRSGRAEVLDAIRHDPKDTEPGVRVSYSDLGFMVLGAVVEAHGRGGLDRFVTEEVFIPLSITSAAFRPDPAVARHIAATEMVDGQALQGVVHDENARTAGGVMGHAGLFATLEGVEDYARAWCSGGGGLFSPAMVAAATRLQTPGLNGRRGYAWALSHDPYDVGGDFWPDTGAGHTGFTGTSLQIDPTSGVWAVLLTNRVHFGRGTNINPLRRRFHNLVMRNLG